MFRLSPRINDEFVMAREMQRVSHITTTAQLPLQGSLPPQNREKFQ